ncbi:MAG: thioredoxin domain-containing protein [Verrucomicrobia bacterium]|nr:thioredoxin domain-containing protein [Verrucomicrobiota bacterium]
MLGERKSNRLVHEKSPYLLQHAYNPVDWYPWGEEAFTKARTENKPIFLSIGYSTCHWCHVMERESFENEAIAGILNRHFVSIKVDREERPDVDRVYMLFVQSTTGSGGWPLSVFLTPDLRPFLGGTYYPPEDRYGRPGFDTLLNRLAAIWAEAPDKILEQGEHITRSIRNYLEEAKDRETVPLKLEWRDNAYRQFASSFDPEEGGFGPAPKFPRPSVFSFLLRYAHRAGNTAALDQALFTLRKMALGGMYDQIGGGFHRYSVDGRWHVPHFEKMLYDQAQLVTVYTEAYQVSPDPLFAKTVRETLEYVLTTLRSPGGGFFSAEDADSLPAADAPEKREGAFYVWTKEELEQVLSLPEVQVFCRTFGVERDGNVNPDSDPHGELHHQNVLFVQNEAAVVAKLTGRTPEEVAALLDSAREKLRRVRDQRPRPHLDDKVVTAWNGLMLTGLAKAYQVFGEVRYLQAAQTAARFIREQLYPGRLLRSFREGPGRVQGFAEDYAFLIQGLLDLYESDFNVDSLRWAGELQVQMNALFADPRGGFFNTAENSADILFRMRDDHDGAEPAANSVAAFNLVRLARIFGRNEFQYAASRIVGSSAETLERVPSALPQLLVAMDAALAEPMQLVVAAHRTHPQLPGFLSEIRSRFMLNRVVLLADGGDGQTWLAEHVEALRAMRPEEAGPVVYLCRNFACELPIKDRGELSARLEKLSLRQTAAG